MEETDIENEVIRIMRERFPHVIAAEAVACRAMFNASAAEASAATVRWKRAADVYRRCVQRIRAHLGRTYR